MEIKGDILDSMLAWHVLNSALPKGLGFITPFYAQDAPMWKHQSIEDPAGYNCQDSDMTLRCFLGIKKDLKENGLWKVFDRHVVQLDRVFAYMSEKGVLRDEALRAEAEERVSRILTRLETEMEEVIPDGARDYKIYKKTPKITEGLVEVGARGLVRRCSNCGHPRPLKPHFKVTKKTQNLCVGARVVESEEAIKQWARPLPFRISKVALLRYQKALRHRAIVDRKEGKITFDENAIIKLQKMYPKDPLYPRILEFRGNQKLLSTYIGITLEDGHIRGGMQIGRDGRIHASFTHNPSTLRSACQNPNLQNLPRPKGADDLASIIRNLIVAGPGCIFTARDYSGIEAVLVGYFALSPRYIRLSKIDVHSFYTAYALHELDGRVKANDLPDFSWPDDRLIPHLAAIKKEFKADRNNLFKHLVHGGNFMQGAMGAREKILNETGISYPVATVQKVMDVYFELFPEIRKWHGSVLQQAERDGYIRNPFGYVHRFYRPYEYEKVGGKWEKRPGPDANKVIAFGPQSTAAGIIKEAMLRLYYERFEEAGQYLRLLVHDELFSETPEDLIDKVDSVVQEEMEKPIPELALPQSWGMGESLVILTEAKNGKRWGEMH